MQTEDGDIGDNALVKYEIVDEESDFTVDPYGGQLYVQRKFEDYSKVVIQAKNYKSTVEDMEDEITVKVEFLQSKPERHYQFFILNHCRCI